MVNIHDSTQQSLNSLHYSSLYGRLGQTFPRSLSHNGIFLISSIQTRGLPSLMVRVFGNLERNFLATIERSGANGRAERYIWGALWEMGMRNAEMNLRASRINDVSSFLGGQSTSELYCMRWTQDIPLVKAILKPFWGLQTPHEPSPICSWLRSRTIACTLQTLLPSHALSLDKVACPELRWIWNEGRYGRLVNSHMLYVRRVQVAHIKVELWWHHSGQTQCRKLTFMKISILDTGKIGSLPENFQRAGNPWMTDDGNERWGRKSMVDMRPFLTKFSMSKLSTPGSFVSTVSSNGCLAEIIAPITKVTTLISFFPILGDTVLWPAGNDQLELLQAVGPTLERT